MSKDIVCALAALTSSAPSYPAATSTVLPPARFLPNVNAPILENLGTSTSGQQYIPTASSSQYIAPPPMQYGYTPYGENVKQTSPVVQSFGSQEYGIERQMPPQLPAFPNVC
jgi:hypothetical protein